MITTKLKKIDLKGDVTHLNEQRKKGNGVSLAKHLRDEYNATPGELYQVLEINPAAHRFGDLWAGPEWRRYLAPEIVRDAVISGINLVTFENLVIASSGDGKSIEEFPYIDVSEMASKTPPKRSPGASYKQFPFTARSKFVGTQEYGNGLTFPYKFTQLEKLNLNILPIYFQAFGTQVGRDMWLRCIQTLLVGDKGINSLEDKTEIDQTPITVGVKDKTKGIQEIDFNHVLMKMVMAGKTATTLICNDTVGTDALSWKVFSTLKPDSTQITAVLARALPSNIEIIPTIDVGEKAIILNKNFGLHKFVEKCPVIEMDKIISKQLEEAFISCSHGLNLLLRSSRVVIDNTLDYSAEQWKDWFLYA